MSVVIQTDRLTLRQVEVDDADFILTLVNDPAWLRYIGDRGIRSIDDAENYIRNGPRASYNQNGFGLWLVQPRDQDTRMGLCGLLKRDTLDAPDLGFAFLPEFRRQGHAFECAQTVLDHAHRTWCLTRLWAIASPDNERSIRLLQRLGFAYKDERALAEGSPISAVFQWQANLSRTSVDWIFRGDPA